MIWKKIFLCLLSSILLVLSFPPFNLFPLAWIALVPLFLTIKESSPKKSFLYGFFTGFLAYLGLLYWIVTTIAAAGEPLILGILCLLLLSIYLSLYFGLFCLGFTFFSHRSPITDHLSPAFLWISLEYLRSHLFTGFPWALLGYSQWNFLPIIQISEFTSVYGVSFLIVLVNTTLFRLWEIGNREWGMGNRKWVIGNRLWGKIKVILPTVIIFLICLVYGFFYLSTYQPTCPPFHFGRRVNLSTPLKVVLLQGNIDQYKKWSRQYEQEIMDKYTQLVCLAAKDKPDIIIWPESAIPGYLLYERHLYERVKKLVQQSNSYHLIGSLHHKEDKLYNSVFLFSPEGKLIQEYDKIHLVPFGETIPLKGFLSRYIKVLNELGDFSPGKDFTLFTISHINLSTYLPPVALAEAGEPINAVTFSANICFESIFPHLVRKFVKRGDHLRGDHLNGAEIIINLTNDAWYLKTSAPYQHFTMNVFRAVENRRYVVRCANTGISAFIDPYGRITRKTKIFTTLTLSDNVYPEKRMTFYTIYGDIFALFCLITTVVFLLAQFLNIWRVKFHL